MPSPRRSRSAPRCSAPTGAFGLGAAGGQRLWKCLAAPPAAVSDARRERQDRAQEKFARYEKVPPPTGLPSRGEAVCVENSYREGSP